MTETTPAVLAASTVGVASQPTDPSVFDPAGRVLDIEKLRAVQADPLPSDAGPTCDVLVIGGGTGGVAAAEALARRGISVILTEPTSSIGGQFTSQLVATPDENRYIGSEPGPSTKTYRYFRQRLQIHYANTPDILPGKEKNVGQCWVSPLSGAPDVWEQVFRERLGNFSHAWGIRQILTRHQLRSVGLLANGRFNYADLVDLDTGKVTRIGARFMLDATEDGSAMAIAGLPTVIGQEAQSEYSEPHAPADAHPEWVQSFTYCFAVRYEKDGAPAIVEKPAEYDFFKSIGVYSLIMSTSTVGTVPYKMFATAKGAAGPFWSYRRLVASSSYKGGHSPEGDISMINWRGNDYHEETYLGQPLDEQVRVLQRGKSFAQGFLYYLQTECPRDDGSGIGYPEIRPVNGPAEMAVADANGIAIAPYVRESRRLKAKFMLNENHLTAPAGDPNAKWGEEFFDSVGCALYSIDIHPAKGEPPLLIKALPYQIPLGSFLTTAGPTNVLPAAKNFGASRLASASARMHPTEWLAGEVAGSLAAFCIRHDIDDPSQVRDTPALLAEFQQNLREGGITLAWRDVPALKDGP